MSKEVKIRLVRCPRCRGLLPELPGHPVYRCASCETVIQAKIQRNGCVESEADSGRASQEQGVIEVKKSKTSLDQDTSEDTCLSQEPCTSSSSEYSQVSFKPKLAEDNNEEAQAAGYKLPKNVAGLRAETNHGCLSSDSCVSLCFTSPEQENQDYDAPSFRRNGWLDAPESSPCTDLSSQPDLEQNSMSKSPATSSFHHCDGGESCYHEMDDPKLKKFSSRPFRSHEMISRDSSGYGGIRPPHNLRKDLSRFPPLDSRGSLGVHGFNKLKQFLEPDQKEILRKIQELEDNLKGISNIPLHTKFPVAYHNLSGHACSRDSARHEDQVRCPCLHCSSKMPQSSHHFSHSDHNSYDSSRSVSTQQGTTKKHLGITETNLEEGMSRLNLEKMSRTVKRALLPVRSGAPFVACYSCGELLHLSSDFII